MKLLLKVLGGIVLLAVLAVILVPMFISTEDIAKTVTAEVAKSTGRQLTVDGEPALTILPSLSLQMNGVRLSNMETGSQADMISMKRLDVHIPWGALLSGELVVERFVIEEPVILLETDAEGVANWDMMPTSETAPEAEAGGAATLPAGFDVRLGDVAIRGGSLTYIDGQAGTEEKLDDLGLAIQLPSLYEDMKLQGTVTYLGEALTLDIVVATPARAIQGEVFEVDMQLDSSLVQLGYKGSIAEQGGSVKGSLNLAGDSVKKLAAWQGAELEAADEAFNAFQFSGDMLFSGDTLQLQQLVASLDALEIKGNSTLVLAEIPDITANVDLGMLDLNPYLPPPVDEPATEAVDESAASEPIVWDDTPIDLSALGSVNANITLRSDGLRAREIKLGENALSLILKDSKMLLSLDKFQAYDGSGKGKVDVNGSSNPYRIATSFDLSGINAEPLLIDVAGFDKLRGTGNLNWSLTTSGRSQKDFVEALNGELGFSFQDGAVRGANVAAIARSAQGIATGDLSKVSLDKNFDRAAETDFSEMGGSFQFSRGVGTNSDLALASPLIRVKGEGSIDLPATKIDYVAITRLVGTIEGQKATGKSKGVGLPIKIKGPFHDVKIKPDLGSAVKEGTLDSLKNKLFKRFGR